MGKKEQIIVKAMELFVDQGFENTPTSQISKESNVATGTLFHHFKTKEDLINEIYIFIKKDLLRDIAETIGKDDSVKNVLNKFWSFYIKWAFENKTEYAYILKFNNSGYVTEKTIDVVIQEFSFYEDVVNKGINENIFRSIPSKLIWKIYGNIGESIIDYIYESGNYDKDLADEGFEMFWNAVKK